jgi:hypothetical protein
VSPDLVERCPRELPDGRLIPACLGSGSMTSGLAGDGQVAADAHLASERDRRVPVCGGPVHIGIIGVSL